MGGAVLVGRRSVKAVVVAFTTGPIRVVLWCGTEEGFEVKQGSGWWVVVVNATPLPGDRARLTGGGVVTAPWAGNKGSVDCEGQKKQRWCGRGGGLAIARLGVVVDCRPARGAWAGMAWKHQSTRKVENRGGGRFQALGCPKG